MSLWRRLSLFAFSRIKFLQSFPADKAAWTQRGITTLPKATKKAPQENGETMIDLRQNTMKNKSSKAEGGNVIDAPLKVVTMSKGKEETIDALAKTTTKKKKKKKKKNSSRTKEETRTSFMFPSLHEDIVAAVSGQIAVPQFHKRDSNQGVNNEYETHVMGKFKCQSHDCSTSSWNSKRVALLIRGYPGNEYNAVVFNQRCKSCYQLGSLRLDEASYIDRVTYRLKKWAGLSMEGRQFTPGKGPPHESSLCEGCKRGRCQEKGFGAA